MHQTNIRQQYHRAEPMSTFIFWCAVQFTFEFCEFSLICSYKMRAPHAHAIYFERFTGPFHGQIVDCVLTMTIIHAFICCHSLLMVFACVHISWFIAFKCFQSLSRSFSLSSSLPLFLCFGMCLCVLFLFCNALFHLSTYFSKYLDIHESECSK